ncbi:MAG: GNAT family N-acetyltransferase [Methylobacterium sp.]|nr:GNAT family N-acetyltransferase [Methylobacterium sp.]
MTVPTRSAKSHKKSAGTPTIRLATLDDLDALVALEHAAFASDQAERRAIRHAIRSASMSVLVAVDDEKEGAEVLVAAATLERRRGTRFSRLSSIAVSPTRIGRGLGTIMLQAAEEDARIHACAALRLEVRADNGAGIRLYERHGYKRFAVIEDYYEDGMEAWRYEKAL